jgi:hypothetical protein
MTESTRPRRVPTLVFTLVALGIALVAACIVSLTASAHPDGLEFVAESTGFLGTAEDSAVAAGPFADYAAIWVDTPWLSVAIAGALGCALTFALAWLIGRVAAPRRRAQ